MSDEKEALIEAQQTIALYNLELTTALAMPFTNDETPGDFVKRIEDLKAPLRTILALDVDALSPIEALTELYRLKRHVLTLNSLPRTNAELIQERDRDHA
jgi:hypothetical protein